MKIVAKLISLYNAETPNKTKTQIYNGIAIAPKIDMNEPKYLVIGEPLHIQ